MIPSLLVYISTLQRIIFVAAWLGIMTFLGTNVFLKTVYSDRIMPGVRVAGVDIGGLKRSQAYSLLSKRTGEYALNLNIAGADYSFKPTEFGVQYDVDEALRSAYSINRYEALVWPAVNATSVELPMFYRLDHDVSRATAQRLALENTKAAVDAALLVVDGQPIVQPDRAGVGVTASVLAAQALSALAEQAPRLVIEAKPVPAAIKASDVSTAVLDVRDTLTKEIVLTSSGRTYSASKAIIGSWLAFDTNRAQRRVAVGVDPAKVKAYVANIARSIDKAPVTKYVTAINGEAKGFSGGTEGLAVDQPAVVKAITSALASKQALRLEIPVLPVAYKTVYNNTASLEYGRYIEINLSQQRLWAYQDHQVVYNSAVTTGAKGAGLGTVVGLFNIYYKTTNTYLTGPGYRLHVDYWMPFHLGYGMHDAYWRSNFGGQDYYYGGSHGCVNMPDATAAWIYYWAEVGTPVWVHY